MSSQEMEHFAFNFLRDLYVEEDVIALVFTRDHSSLLHELRDEDVVALQNPELKDFAQGGDLFHHQLHQSVKARLVECRNLHCFGVFEANPVDHEAAWAKVYFI